VKKATQAGISKVVAKALLKKSKATKSKEPVKMFLRLNKSKLFIFIAKCFFTKVKVISLNPNKI
jgi:hypothetical protein